MPGSVPLTIGICVRLSRIEAEQLQIVLEKTRGMIRRRMFEILSDDREAAESALAKAIEAITEDLEWCSSAEEAR